MERNGTVRHLDFTGHGKKVVLLTVQSSSVLTRWGFKSKHQKHTRAEKRRLKKSLAAQRATDESTNRAHPTQPTLFILTGGVSRLEQLRMV